MDNNLGSLSFLSPTDAHKHTHIYRQIQSPEIKRGEKKYICKHLKDWNPALGASSLFQSREAGEVCLRPALPCDWLTGYWAEQRVSQVSGKEGKQDLWDVLFETGRDKDLMSETWSTVTKPPWLSLFMSHKLTERNKICQCYKHKNR